VADIADKLTDGEGRVAKLLGTYPGIESRSIINKKERKSSIHMCTVKSYDMNKIEWTETWENT